MTDHDHTEPGLFAGCPRCIADARHAEEEARWAEAPLRLVRWRATYFEHYEGEKRFLTFDRWLRVPDDATPAEVDNRYAPITGEAFVLALPDSVDMSSTDFAVETSDFSLPTIDRRTPAPRTAEDSPPYVSVVLELFPNNERTTP